MALSKSLLGSICFFTCLLALSPAEQPPAVAFEVASVRLSPPDSLGFNSSIKTDNTRLDYVGSPLSQVLRRAFHLEQVDQLAGPSWLDDVHIDIHATLPAGSSKDQAPEMLQSLMAQRFGLQYHREHRPTPVYNLKTINGAALLKPANDDEQGKPPEFSGTGGKYICHRLTMDDLVKTLNAMRLRPFGPFRDLNRNVIDATGLQGKYDFTLNMGSPRSPDAVPNAPDDTRTLAQALKDIGLMLEPDRLQTDYIVVDQILKAPTQN